jgi:hypothetical protein
MQFRMIWSGIVAVSDAADIGGDMSANRKDIAAGGVFAAFGLVYGADALMNLPIGEALNMGPGYFPVMLSALLIVIGAVVAFNSLKTAEIAPFGSVPWRGVIMLSLSTIVFAAFLRNLGMFPAIAISSFIAALSSQKMRLVTALLISLGLAVFCTAVFGYGLKLPLPIFGTWFGG